MCKPNSDFHFCTCASIKKEVYPISADKNLNQAHYQKTQLLWSLYKYLGKKESLIMGQMIMPVESLDNLITSANVIQEFNSRNVFDFKYSPAEGDNLQIRKEYIYKAVKGISRPDLFDFMSIIFRRGKWEEGVYDVFGEKIRKFQKGKIKQMP